MKAIKILLLISLLFGTSCKKDPDIQPFPNEYTPNNSTKADNGRTDGKDSIVWDFKWPTQTGATEYYIYVKNATATYPILDKVEISVNHYHFVSTGGYIAYPYYENWTWKVKARINNQWTDWSKEISFSVEPSDTDKP